MIQITTLENNSVVSLLTGVQKSFIKVVHLRKTAQAVAFDHLNLVATEENMTDPNPIVFSWDNSTLRSIGVTDETMDKIRAILL